MNRMSRYLWKKLRKVCFLEKYKIFSRKVDKDSRVRVPHDIYFREAKIEDVPQVIRTFQPHYTEKDHGFLVRRVQSGEYLILGYLKGDPDILCSVSWMSEIDQFFIEEQKINHRSGAICLYRVFVLKDYRNRGISRNMLFYLEHWAKEKGYIEIVTYIRSSNAPQLRVMEHAGWADMGRLYKIVLLGNKIYRLKNVTRNG